VAKAVDREVIQRTALLIANLGVKRLPVRQPGDIVGDEALQEIERPRTLNAKLAHMRDIEHARALADGAVFFKDAAILNGHLPAAELDETRAQRAMLVIERGTFEPRRRGIGRRCICAHGARLPSGQRPGFIPALAHARRCEWAVGLPFHILAVWRIVCPAGGEVSRASIDEADAGTDIGEAVAQPRPTAAVLG